MTRRILFLLPAALLSLAVCRADTEVEKANREKILLVGNLADPRTLDPHLATGVIESNLFRALFEGLVADHESSDTDCPPGAASSWEHNETFTEWTFHLRPEGKWSDGTPLTAGDFLFAYERILKQDLAAPYAEMLYFIKGAESFNKGEIKDFKEVGVTAPDDYTLKLALREPVPFLPLLTRHYTWFPLPRHVVLKHGTMAGRFNPWSQPDKLVGNGAFILKQWKPKERLELVKNPLFRDADKVKLNGLSFIPAKDSDAETRAFLAGQLHTTYQLPIPLVDRMRANFRQYLRQEPYFATDFIRVNLSRRHLDNPKLRMALSLAIDRKLLCDNLLKGNRPTGTINPEMGDYRPEPVVSFDRERAKALLEEAGYREGLGLPHFKLLMSGNANRAVAEALQATWRKTLGIEVDIDPRDWGGYVTAQQTLDYDMAFAAWVGDYPDPTTFLMMWTKDNGNNNTDWSSEEYEKLLADATRQPDPAQRLAIFKKAERLLMEEQPVLPVCQRGCNYLLRPEVKGWHPLLLGNHPWHTISLEP